MELQEIVSKAVSLIDSGKAHEDYQRTVNLSKDYRKIITTKGLEEDLKRTSPPEETDDMFEIRLEITQFTTKSVASNIKKVFYDVGKSDNLQKRIAFDKDNEGKSKEELERAIKTYAGNKNLEDYLGIDLVDLVFEDPNAFIVTGFDSFDGEKERAKPYPTIYYSDKVKDYCYKNNLLQYLMVEKSVMKENSKGEFVDVHSYFIFQGEENIEITERPDKEIIPGERFIDDRIYEDDKLIAFVSKGSIYDLRYYLHETGFVSAFRAGYETDPETKHRTYIGPLDPAMPHFNKSVKIGSELDITITKHAHPKEYRFVTKTNGNQSAVDIAADINAQNGSAPKSALEVTEVSLPSGQLMNEDVVDLSKLAYTHHLPVEFVEWLSKHVDAIEAKCKKSVFNSDTFERDSSVSTATEKRIERDAVNSTLSPFGDKYSEAYKFTVRTIASQMDLSIENLSITHFFNGEFKSVTVEELIDQYKLLEEASAPAQIKEKVAKEITEKQFKDDPIGLRKINIKSEHNPFKGKSKEEIMFLLSSMHVSESSKVLYSNFDQVFSELDMEIENFFALKFKDRKVAIDKKVEEIKAATVEQSSAFVPALLEEEDE